MIKSVYNVCIAVVLVNGFLIVSSTGIRKCCKNNERWVKCPDSLCIPMTCSQLGFSIDCPPKDECECLGEPRCICNEGYVRNDKGVCIPQNQCPLTCGPNEVYSTCANGGCGKWNCTQIGQPDLCIDPITCEDGCVCRKGYLRSRDGKCISEKNCYADLCPKANEIYDLCPAPCPFRTCGIDDRAIFCAKPLDCAPPACRCKDGFYRDHNGECVTWDQCPNCSGPNEVYDPCPAPCPPRRCDVDERVIRCAAPPKLGSSACQPACRCVDGYVRNDKGICVTREECPKCTRAHEVYNSCPETCPPQTCESIGKVYWCPLQTECKQCEGACVCESGYYRSKNGECISKEDCLKCNGPNEYFSCGGACDNVCSTLSTQNQTHCPIINKTCNKMCYCEEGHARDDKNVCIPIDQCPTTTDTCNNNNNNNNNNGNSNDDELNSFTQGSNGFTGNLLYEVVQNKPGESVILSPFSILTILAELILYCTGDSLQELLKVLNLPNKDQTRDVFLTLKNTLESEQKNTLDLGAKVYVNQEYKISDNFKEDTKNVFDAEAEQIDVSKPEEASKIINDWVEDITRNMIKDLVSPDMITSLTRLILANAIYFKGTWNIKFDPKNTKDRDFHVNNDTTIQVPTMLLKDKFNYAESSDINAKAIELPYVGENIRFICVLPNSNDGLNEVLDKVKDPAVFDKLLKSMSNQTVTVALPKMDIKTTTNLKEMLPKVHVTKIFSATGSGLSGILKNNDEYLYVSDAIQKAAITIDEEGSVATAANAFVVSTYSVVIDGPKEYYFFVDHPALYYIMFDEIILFCGVFVRP